MTLEEYHTNLTSLAEEYNQRAVEAVFVPAANELLATVKNRIINEGENSSGTKIGQYSTKPAYFSPQAYVKQGSFSAVGKTGEKVFKNGKPHKSEYIPSGYSGLRAKQGRETAFMNMEYSGSTLLSYQMQVKTQEILLGMTNKEASDIRHGQEKKRGRIFSAQQSEIDTYNKNVSEETERLTLSILKK